MTESDSRTALPVAASKAGAVRFGAYMLRRFGWFYYATGLHALLKHVHFREHSAERIRTAAATGPVVYVILGRSSLDHLAVNTALNQRRLPLSVWADGVTAFFWQPVVEAWRDVARRTRTVFQAGLAPDPVASGWLEQTVASGIPVTLFVEDRTKRDTSEAFEAIVRAQALTERPIQLVPILVVWNRAPEQASASSRQWLNGNRERPSPFAKLRSAILGRGDTFVQTGDPVNLPELIERVPLERQAQALRVLLRRYLRRESLSVRGPRLLTHRVMKRLVLNDPPMRALAAREALATGRSEAKVQRDMERTFDTIAANFRWWAIRVMDIVLRPLWTRVFRGVDVPDADINRIRDGIRDGSVILVPSHKSHFDYLLLSWVLYNHNLIVPHVVAGINLAIPGVRFFLRSAGGFFIQRGSTSDRIFPAVFRRYLSELIRQGYPVEFFIEGGRTRSGKLLPPKLGVLDMVIEAAVTRRAGRAVTLLPIALAYERVAEEQTYARELGGADKEPESIGQVVKATRVFGKRYGRLYLRVGEPIDIGAIADAGWPDLDEREHRPTLQRVGERILHRIGQKTVVLPSSLVALALLAHNQRGIRQSTLLQRIERFRVFLAAAGAEEAASLLLSSRAIRLALGRFHTEKRISPLDSADGERVWVTDLDQRITLEFYKNQVLHWFAPAGLLTLALRTLPPGPFTQDDLLPPYCTAVLTLRREFILDPDEPASALMNRSLTDLIAAGALTETNGSYEIAEVAFLGEIYALFRNFAEAYVAVLRNSGQHDGHSAKNLARLLQGHRDEWLADGTVTRPESLSLVTLENAIRVFSDEGALTGDRATSLSIDPHRANSRLTGLTGWVDSGHNQSLTQGDGPQATELGR